MWWYLGIFILGIVVGLIVEQKFDLLKPGYVRKIEEELEILKREIRTFLAKFD